MQRILYLMVLGIPLYGCAPDGSGHTVAAATAGNEPAVAIASAQPARTSATDDGPSYEVSIASAAADRAHALDACGSKAKPERTACTQAADGTFDEARKAAESKRKAGR